MHFLRILTSLICVYPSDVSHCGVSPLHMKLVFQTNGQAMEWANGSAMLCVVVIQLLRPLQSLIENYFMQAVVLERQKTVRRQLHELL